MVLMQYILIILASLALINLFFQIMRRNLTWSKSFKWFILWLAVIVVAIDPNVTNQLANMVGIGRGADFVIYGSLIVIFLLIFKIFLHLNKIEHDISKIVSNLAINNVDKNINDNKE